MSWGPVVWVLLGEMFPNRMRAAALSLAAGGQWVANWIVTVSFPTLKDIGLGLAYGLYAGFALLSFFFVLEVHRGDEGQATGGHALLSCRSGDHREHRAAVHRAWRVYSAVIARSTSIRAARRAGQTAASTPTTAASTTKISSCDGRHAQHADALVGDGPLQADPEDQPEADAQHGAEHRDGHRLQPDHRPQLTPAHPDRAQQPDLPGPFDHRQRQGVDDAQHRDDHGQPEQGVDDGQQLVDRRPLVGRERRPGP